MGPQSPPSGPTMIPIIVTPLPHGATRRPTAVTRRHTAATRHHTAPHGQHGATRRRTACHTAPHSNTGHVCGDFACGETREAYEARLSTILPDHWAVVRGLDIRVGWEERIKSGVAASIRAAETLERVTARPQHIVAVSLSPER